MSLACICVDRKHDDWFQVGHHFLVKFRSRFWFWFFALVLSFPLILSNCSYGALGTSDNQHPFWLDGFYHNAAFSFRVQNVFAKTKMFVIGSTLLWYTFEYRLMNTFLVSKCTHIENEFNVLLPSKPYSAYSSFLMRRF